MDPSNSQVLYAAVGYWGGTAQNGVYVTTDGGNTWAVAGNFPMGSVDGRISLAVAPSNPQIVYAAVAPTGQSGSVAQLLKSTDGGTTWNEITVPTVGQGLSWYIDVVAVAPTNPNTVYLDNTAESTDGGNTWTDISVGVDGNGPHVDHHAAAFDANGKLLDGNDGGTWRLDDPTPGAVHWTDLNGNLGIIQFYSVALHPTDPNIVYGGSQDNGTSEFTGSQSWSLLTGGDGGNVLVDPNNPETVYHTYYYGNYAFLERSDDGGVTWTGKVNGINTANPGDFIPPLVMDPSNSSRLLFGNTQVYETTDRADDWSPISTPGTNGWFVTNTIDALAVSQSSPSTIYASAGGHILVTFNDGGSWQQVDIPAVSGTVPSLLVDPSNSMIAYAAQYAFTGSSAGHVFRTVNGGQTWSDISGNVPDIPVNTIALDPRDNVLYIGTDDQVYSSLDLGGSWSVLGAGLPNVQVRQLVVNTNLDLLAAATHGRGAWEIPLESDHFLVTPSLTITSAGTAFSITVTALDANNNTITDFAGTVHFTSTDGSAVLPSDYTFQSSDAGSHTFTNGVTLVIAGIQSIEADDPADGISGNTSVTVTPGAATHIGVSAPSSTTAGSKLSITVTALDAYNNTATGYTGTVHFTSSDGQAILPADYSFTSSDAGVHSFSGQVTLKTAGNRTVTATDTVTSSISGSQTITVNPAAASKLVISGFPTSITAGVSQTFTLTVQDPFGNTATGYTGTVAFTSSDTKASLPSSYSFTSADAGTHQFTPGATFKTAAKQSLTATDKRNSKIKGTQSGITVNPAAASTLSVSGFPSTITAGQAGSVTVTAKDPYGNTATGYTGTIHFTSSERHAK
jgi:hypothetical protein